MHTSAMSNLYMTHAIRYIYASGRSTFQKSLRTLFPISSSNVASSP